MNTATKKRLAQAMKIDPAMILDYRAITADNYTVILTNYQKFINVSPAKAKARKKSRSSSISEMKNEENN